MLQGLSISVIAKVCAALAVTTGASIATYEIAIDSAPEPTGVAVAAERSSSSLDQDDPAALAFAAEADENGVARLESERERAVPEKAHRNEADEKRLEKARKAAETSEVPSAEEAEKREAEEATGETDTDPPELIILHPEDGSRHERDKVVFEGETEPGAVVKAGRYEADVDADGNWRIELILGPGANRATITAFDRAGNVADASVTVHLEVFEPVEEPKDEQPEEPEHEPEYVEFAANQKWGSCEEVVPYDVFWGTATPSTVVHIVSEYGSAQVEVDKHGSWEKKVYFENAPRGEAFAVVIEGVNGRKVFEFLATEVPRQEPDKEQT